MNTLPERHFRNIFNHPTKTAVFLANFEKAQAKWAAKWEQDRIEVRQILSKPIK